MRHAIMGIVIGVVVGIVIGATMLAPRLHERLDRSDEEASERLPAPELPRLVSPIREPAVQWRMASAFPGSLPQLGRQARRIEDIVWRVSAGDMEIRFLEPDTLVPVAEMFDAVAAGAVEAAFASPALWSGREPAYDIFAAVPFGPSATEYLAWIYSGGGMELFQTLNEQQNVHGLICGIIVPEGSGWFREAIRSVDDLAGLRMSFVGIGARVMEKLGVETRPLTGGDIFVALENGIIDGVEYSTPAIDLKLGLQEVVKNYYLPGWHQPTTLISLMVNLNAWESLSSTAQTRLEVTCGDNVRLGLAEGEANQFKALQRMNASGVEIIVWPREILVALEAAWTEIVAEQATANENFREVWNSLSEFRRDYAIWKELGHL